MSASSARAAGTERAEQLVARLVGHRARVLGIGLAALGLAAGVLVSGAGGGTAPRVDLQPTALAAEAAPLGSQSSSWYCTGGTGPAKSPAATTIVLANAGSHRVAGTMDAVDEKGATGTQPFSIPPGGQIDERPGAVVTGAWVAARLEVRGGGVTASELVDGPSGSSVAPCTSETSARWYFAQGTTVQGASLIASLFNPTANLAVVDLTFHTPSGLISPAPDQGIVIDPGRLVAVTVGKYVQDKPEVATVVSARSGVVAAAELQRYDAAGVAGTSLVAGSPAPADRWVLPRLFDIQGGASDLAVLNPSPSASAHVRVHVGLPTGTAAPFDAVVAPSSVWTLQTSAQLRIPNGADYSLEVTATGVPGVVVGRIGEGTAQTSAPQWGSQAGISLPATSVASTRWLVPSIAPVATTAGAGVPAASAASRDAATPSGGVVVFENPGTTAQHASVRVMTAAGSRRLGVVHVAPHGSATFGARVGPLSVDASGPLVTEAVATPVGAAGVVALAAVPQR